MFGLGQRRSRQLGFYIIISGNRSFQSCTLPVFHTTQVEDIVTGGQFFIGFGTGDGYLVAFCCNFAILCIIATAICGNFAEVCYGNLIDSNIDIESSCESGLGLGDFDRFFGRTGGRAHRQQSQFVLSFSFYDEAKYQTISILAATGKVETNVFFTCSIIRNHLFVNHLIYRLGNILYGFPLRHIITHLHGTLQRTACISGTEIHDDVERSFQLFGIGKRHGLYRIAFIRESQRAVGSTGIGLGSRTVSSAHAGNILYRQEYTALFRFKRPIVPFSRTTFALSDKGYSTTRRSVRIAYISHTRILLVATFGIVISPAGGQQIEVALIDRLLTSYITGIGNLLRSYIRVFIPFAYGNGFNGSRAAGKGKRFGIHLAIGGRFGTVDRIIDSVSRRLNTFVGRGNRNGYIFLILSGCDNRGCQLGHSLIYESVFGHFGIAIFIGASDGFHRAIVDKFHRCCGIIQCTGFGSRLAAVDRIIDFQTIDSRLGSGRNREGIFDGLINTSSRNHRFGTSTYIGNFVLLTGNQVVGCVYKQFGTGLGKTVGSTSSIIGIKRNHHKAFTIDPSLGNGILPADSCDSGLCRCIIGELPVRLHITTSGYSITCVEDPDIIPIDTGKNIMFGIKIYAIYRKRWSSGCSGVTAIRPCGRGFGIPECFGRKNRYFTYDLIERCCQGRRRTGFTRQYNEVIAGETVGFKLSGQRFIVVIESCYVHTGSYKCIVHAFGRLGSSAEIGHFGSSRRSLLGISTSNHEVIETDFLSSVAFKPKFDNYRFTFNCNVFYIQSNFGIHGFLRTERFDYRVIQFYRPCRCFHIYIELIPAIRTKTTSIYSQFCRGESNPLYRSQCKRNCRSGSRGFLRRRNLCKENLRIKIGILCITPILSSDKVKRRYGGHRTFQYVFGRESSGLHTTFCQCPRSCYSFLRRGPRRCAEEQGGRCKQSTNLSNFSFHDRKF